MAHRNRPETTQNSWNNREIMMETGIDSVGSDNVRGGSPSSTVPITITTSLYILFFQPRHVYACE